MSQKDLRECVRKALDEYYEKLDGERPSQVYRMVTDLVDRTVVESALDRTNNNYSQASKLLGISRSTLKKKLAKR